MAISYFSLTLGLLLMVFSVLLLRQAWLQKRRNPRQLITAWALFLLGFVPVVSAGNADWGTAVSLCLFMMAGFGMLSLAALRQPEGRTKREARVRAVHEDRKSLDWRAGGRRLAVFLLAGPISAMAALFITTWYFGAVMSPGGELWDGQVTTTLFAWPILWALLATVACYDMSLVRRGAIVLGSCLAGAAGTYLTVGAL